MVALFEPSSFIEIGPPTVYLLSLALCFCHVIDMMGAPGIPAEVPVKCIL